MNSSALRSPYQTPYQNSVFRPSGEECVFLKAKTLQKTKIPIAKKTCEMWPKNVPRSSDRGISIANSIFGLLVLCKFWQNINATVGSGLPHRTDFVFQAAGFQSQIRFVRFFLYINFDKLSALRCDLEAHADT